MSNPFFGSFGPVVMMGGIADGPFPVIAASSQDNTGASTSHSVTLPSGIVTGSLVIIFFAHTEAVGGSGNPTAFPAGWTELEDVECGNASQKPVLAIGYRICDGSEGASITVTTNDNLRACYICHRISLHHASAAPEKGTASNDSASNTTSDPPSLSPSWGGANTLWFAASAVQANIVAPTYPANYSYDQKFENTGGIAGATRTGLAVAVRQIYGATEDPGTFTWTSSPDVAQTVAVRST